MSGLRFRVERTEYAEIEVDVAGLLAEWAPDQPEADEPIEDFVRDRLWDIGVEDLMWSGDFITVTDRDKEEGICAIPA